MSDWAVKLYPLSSCPIYCWNLIFVHRFQFRVEFPISDPRMASMLNSLSTIPIFQTHRQCLTLGIFAEIQNHSSSLQRSVLQRCYGFVF